MYDGWINQWTSHTSLWDLTRSGHSGPLCLVAWKEHQPQPTISPLVPLGGVRLDSSRVLNQIPFFPRAPRDPSEPGGCCSPPCPNPELILQCLHPIETLLGKLRRHEVLDCCEKVEEIPPSWGPGPRTQTPSDGKGPPKLLPLAQDQCPSPFKPQLETTGFTCTSIHLAEEAPGERLE